jgi:hypothetical protein
VGLVTDYREFAIADRYLRAAVAVTCAYEVVAITTRKWPTVSRLVQRYPLLGTIVLAALARHFDPIDEVSPSINARREGTP